MGRKSLLRPAQWLKIQARYEGGDKIKDIARDWGITPSAISNHAKKNGWVHGDKYVKSEIAARAREKVIDSESDEQANRIKRYLQGNTKRVGDMYEMFDLLLFTQKQRAHFLAVASSQAINKAKKENAEREKAEMARVSIEGGEPRPIEQVLPKLPNMGKAPLDATRLSECLNTLDLIHRRILGLDGKGGTEEDIDDPLQQWVEDIASARAQYEKRKKKMKENVDDFKEITDLATSQKPVEDAG